MQRQGELCTCRWWLAAWIGKEKAGLGTSRLGESWIVKPHWGKDRQTPIRCFFFDVEMRCSGGVAIVMLCGRDVRFNLGVGLIYRKSWRLVEFFENSSRRK